MTETETKSAALSFEGKQMLTLEETVKYTGLSKGYLYILNSQKRIPYYKPLGRKIYYDKSELDAFLHGNRQNTKSDIARMADEHRNKYRL